MNAVDYFNKQANDNGYFDVNQNRELNTELTEAQQNEIAKNFIIGQKYNKGGISNTFVNGLTDRSKYDYDINWNDNPFKSNDIGDLRAEAQGGLGRLKDATINNITIAGTTALSSSIGFVGGVISAAIQGDASKIWDNDFTNKLNELQKGVTESNQIYRGQEYQNKSFLGKLTDGIFWADLWQNAGYMEGMLIPGTAMGKAAKATQIAAKFPKMTKVVTNLIAASGEASMEALNQKDEAYDNLFNQATDLYYNKLELAKNDNERRSAYDEYLSNLDLIKNDAVKQGNRTFAGNMVILTTTGTLEFGDFVSRGYGESHKLLNRIARNELGQATAKGLGSDIARGTGQFLKNFTVEGLEEYTQRGAASGAANTKGANQFLSKYADELNIELADNYLQAVGQAWVDDFDNEEAWLEFMSGAILGGLGLPGSHNGIRAQISDAKKEGDLRRKLAQEVNNLEGNLNINPSDLKDNGKLQETLDFLIRKQGITQNQKDALYNRDKNEFVNSRVEDILNYAMLYDNIGELDEFKERLKQYSTIDNQDQLTGENGLVTATQDENGNSPFKDKSISEVNQLLKESYDFWNKTIDSYIQGKQILDTMSKGKLDDNTLKRGAISFAQSRNFKDRAGELYNDLNNKINKYQESITKVSNEPKDVEFINNFFEGIKNLSENEVLPTFGSTKTVSSIYALTDFVNKNSSKIDSEVVNDIINPIVDLIKVSYDYYAYNNDFNSILKNAEKEQSKTDKMFNNLKNIKKNYLVKRYAKRLDGISDRKTLQEQIKNVPAEIREDVIDYLRENGSDNTRKAFDDIQEWDNVSRAVTKVINSFDESRFPINRKTYNDEYGSDIVDNTLNIVKDAFNNSSSRNEITDNINKYLDNERAAIDTIENPDEKLARQDTFKKTEKLLNDILKKIDDYSNNERNESNKKKNDSKKKKENIDLNEEEENDNELIEFDIPNYVIEKYIKAIKNNDVEKIKKYLDELKDFDKLPQMIKMAFRLKKDETGNKNRTFLEQVLNELEGNRETNIEGQASEDGGYDGNISETPETSVDDLNKLQPSQEDIVPSEDEEGEEDNSAPEEQAEVNTLLSMAISKYDHRKAAKGRKEFYDENDPIYKLIEEYGGYDFVDNCLLDDFIKYCNKNKIDLTSVIKFIKTSVDYGNRIDPVYILAIESDNAFFEKIAKKTPENVTKKINIDGKNYQVIGTMQERKSSPVARKEFAKLKAEIDKVGDIEVGQFKLSPLTNGISKVNAGRLVFANSNRVTGSNDNNVALSTLLKDIPNEDFEIGVYTDSKTLKLYDSVANSNKLVKPVNPLVGSVYLFVRCADGMYYPRLIRSKKLTANELTLNDANDEFIVGIKDCIRRMCDTSVSDERLKAKDELADLIAFTTDKYKVSDLIWFEGDNIIVGNSAGERVKIKASKDDETVDRIFNAMINLPDLKLTPRIHVGGAGNYNLLKNMLRKSTIVTSDVEMRSIDCNFELFLTDEFGNVVVDETNTSSVTKGKKIDTNDGKVFSFNSNQINEITSKFKKYLPTDLMNIESIAVVKKADDNNETFDFYINNNDEPLSENYDLYNILNWIYNQIQSMPDYSFNEDYQILFKASRNSNNTYSIKVGKGAVSEFNKILKTYQAQEQQEASTDIPEKKDNSFEPTEEPQKPTKTKKKEGKSSVIELGEAELSQGKKPKSQFDSIYKGNTDNQKADDETQECGENPPF